MLKLKNKENLIIGRGNERLCYLFPDDDTKIIKVVYSDRPRNQNKLEYLYYKTLKRINADFSHLPLLYNKIETDAGLGLVYEHIRNYDGSSACTFEDAIKFRMISRSKAYELVMDLYKNFRKNGIVLGDINLNNLLYKKESKDSSTLIVVDGIGPRHLGFKLFFYSHSLLYSRYKVFKQFRILFEKVNTIYDAFSEAADSKEVPQNRRFKFLPVVSFYSRFFS